MLRGRRREDLQVELFVEHGEVTLGRGHEQLGGHADAEAVVAGGVIDQGMAELWGHQAGVAGGGEQLVEAGEQLVAGRDAGGEPGADTAAERDQLLAPQLVEQAGVAGEDDAQQGLGVEAGAGEQAQLAQHAG